MHVLSKEKRVAVATALVEGCSIAATSRITGVSRDAIHRLLLLLGEGCRRVHDKLVRDIDALETEMDELWTFVHKKERRCAADDPSEWGDNYVFVAMGRYSKLVIAFRVGKRNQMNADLFIADLRARTKGVIPLSADAWSCYPSAVGGNFRGTVDFAQVVKHYSRGGRPDGAATDHRYEPPRNPFITKRAVFGAPDLDKASTSRIERSNWTTRGGLRRMTRLSNGFSHKKEHLEAAVALWFTYYNFCRWHETIRCAPAMQAGITTSMWSVEELVEAALSAEPCTPPQPPSRDDLDAIAKEAREEGESAARVTATGSFLRAVPVAKTAPSSAPAGKSPAHARTAKRRPGQSPEERRQLNLFTWARSRASDSKGERGES